MPSSSTLFFSLSLSFVFFTVAFAQPRFLAHVCVDDNNHTTDTAAYRANLDHLLSTVTTDHPIDYGFYSFSYGQQNRAHLIALCIGHTPAEPCQKEAIGWYDGCMLRYSDRPFLGSMEILPVKYLWNVNNASDQKGFTEAARNLIVGLIGEAVLGDSRVKFASGNVTVQNSPTIYGIAQCTPDLSGRECNECLVGALPLIQVCCDGRRGGRVLRPSCNFGYQTYNFLQSPSPSPSPPPPPPVLNRTTDWGDHRRRKKFGALMAMVVPIAAVILILIISIFIFLRNRRPKHHGPNARAEEEITTEGFLQFDFETIRIATHEFSETNKLGEGGFGAVYKGKLPNDGRMVAVKRRCLRFQGREMLNLKTKSF